MEGLRIAKADFSAFLHPSKSGNVRQGVFQLLSSLLLKYNDEFDGALLSYFDLKICDWTAKLLPGLSPYLSVKIKSKFLLFSPKPGMLLEGIVNKVKEDFIGAVVLGIYNVGIGYADIREELRYQLSVDGGNPIWSSASENHTIGLGSRIKFVVKSVQEGIYLDIIGSLMPANAGCVSAVSSSLVDIEEDHNHTRKKKRKHKSKGTEAGNDTHNVEEKLVFSDEDLTAKRAYKCGSKRKRQILTHSDLF